MTSAIAVKNEQTSAELSVIEQVVMQGDLSKLDSAQRVLYYRKVCESAGLNPFTRPFDYITLNGKLTLYAKKDATEQLRHLRGISITKLECKVVDDLYLVIATATTKDGRTDESTGAVTIGHLKGDAKANAIMKAETKAKRRVTLSISGMGWTDESEIESIPGAAKANVDLSTGEIQEPQSNTKKVSWKQAEELKLTLDECDEKYRQWVYRYVREQYKTDNLADLPLVLYDRMKNAAVKNMEATHAKQREQSTAQPEPVLVEV